MGKQKELVSIIVPVYNVENYLERCVKSILGQTYTELEIILVDDGSTDNSGQICDNLEKLDKRIKVIHKKNGGQTSARKKGIQIAGGEYVLCVDSDDWIEDEMIAFLVDRAISENADVVTSGCYMDYEDSSKIIIDSLAEGLYASEEEKNFFLSHMIFNESIETPGIMMSLSTKLIRADIIKKVIMELSEDIRYGEDAATVYGCCIIADRIVLTPKVYYHYMRRNTSITHRTDPYYLREVNEWYLFMKKSISGTDCEKVLNKQIEAFVVNAVIVGIDDFMGFHMDGHIPLFQFDGSAIEPHAKVVLYGAGRVGRSYYKQMQNSDNLQVVAWVDQDYERYQKRGMEISDIVELLHLNYDYIVLAIASEDRAMGIREQLLRMGIEGNKIIWKAPKRLKSQYIKI